MLKKGSLRRNSSGYERWSQSRADSGQGVSPIIVFEVIGIRIRAQSLTRCFP
jgi:hypothetical protein